MTTSTTWQSGDDGWSGVNPSFGSTATRSAGAVCSTSGFWESTGIFTSFFGNRGIVLTTISSDASMSMSGFTIFFEVTNFDGTYVAGASSMVCQMRWADVSGGPWSGSSGSHGIVDTVNIKDIEGCSSFESSEIVSDKYLRITVNGFGDTVTLPTSKIYQLNVPSFASDDFTFTKSSGGIPGSLY